MGDETHSGCLDGLPLLHHCLHVFWSAPASFSVREHQIFFLFLPSVGCSDQGGPNPLDGCRFVYLDMGTNIGVQIRWGRVLIPTTFISTWNISENSMKNISCRPAWWEAGGHWWPSWCRCRPPRPPPPPGYRGTQGLSGREVPSEIQVDPNLCKDESRKSGEVLCDVFTWRYCEPCRESSVWPSWPGVQACLLCCKKSRAAPECPPPPQALHKYFFQYFFPSNLPVLPAKFLIRFRPNDKILRDLRFCKFCTLVIMFVERLNFSQDDKLLRAESILNRDIRVIR